MNSNKTPTGPLNSLRRPPWLPQSVWPFTTSALTVEGSNLAVTDVGTGPTLLFVHTGFWSFIWRDVILQLAGFSLRMFRRAGNWSERSAAGCQYQFGKGFSRARLGHQGSRP
jgi:hypothetical protein